MKTFWTLRSISEAIGSFLRHNIYFVRDGKVIVVGLAGIPENNFTWFSGGEFLMYHVPKKHFAFHIHRNFVFNVILLTQVFTVWFVFLHMSMRKEKSSTANFIVTVQYTKYFWNAYLYQNVPTVCSPSKLALLANPLIDWLGCPLVFNFLKRLFRISCLSAVLQLLWKKLGWRIMSLWLLLGFSPLCVG